MPSKREIAALMSADGDSEKKISLLKKAVVNVTRQKQELEGQHIQLREQLDVKEKELAAAREEAKVLRRRLAAAEVEIDQAKKGNKHFGQSMLKGLSSLMSGTEGGGGELHRGGASGAAPLMLSAEAVEKVVAENESLHVSLYTLKAEHDNAARSAKAEANRQAAELAEVRREVQELRGLLETTTQACDRLNTESLQQRAAIAFCHRFFRLTTRAALPRDVRPLQLSIAPEVCQQTVPGPPAEVRVDQIRRTLRDSCDVLLTVLTAVSTLCATLRNVLPRYQRATVGDLRCFSDRLTTLLEAHHLEKEALAYCIKQLLGCVEADPASSSVSVPQPDADAEGDHVTPASRCSRLLEAEDQFLSAISKWIGTMRASIPLMVDSCVAFLTAEQTYYLSPPQPTSGADEGRHVVERGVFVEEAVKCGHVALTSLEGSLMALRALLFDASESLLLAAAASSSSAALGEWLLALQSFCWNGYSALPRVRHALLRLTSIMEDVAAACDAAQVRDALRYLIKVLLKLVPSTAVTVAEQSLQQETSALADDAGDDDEPVGKAAVVRLSAAAEKRDSPRPLAASDADNRGLCNEDDLLDALAAADRVAVCYCTQLNEVLVEQADMADALQAAEAQRDELRDQLVALKRDARHTQDVLQKQIETLSDQLIDSNKPKW